MVVQISGGATPVALGSLQLSAVDDAGVEWINTGLTGWSSPGLRTQFTSRQADHGAWAGPSYLDPRAITLKGVITAPNRAARDAAVEQLLAAVSLTDTLLVVSESIPKQALVRRSGDVLVEPLSPTSVTYSALVTAADPRRYSTTLQSQSAALPSSSGGLTLPVTLPITITATTVSGTITLTNAGTIATRPVLTVTGPTVGGFTIVAASPSGAITQQTYTDSLGAGDVLVIDAMNRTVTLNSQVSRRLYWSGTWPEIPAQSSLTFQWTCPVYDPSALLTGTVRSAWL